MENVKIFRGYYYIIYISFGFILISSGIISYLQLLNYLEAEKESIRKHLHDDISRMENILGIVHNNMLHFREESSHYLQNDQTLAENKLIPFISDYPIDDYYHLDNIPDQIEAKDRLTISGIGNFAQATPLLRHKASTLLDMTPLFRSIYQHTPNTVFTYYYSWKEKFVAMYPYIPSSTFHVMPENFERAEATYQMAFPRFNPERKIAWTGAYMDATGKGLMVTAAIPTYQRDKFEGLFCIDFTLDSLKHIITQNQFERGTVFLSNDQNQLLAHPTLSQADAQDSIRQIEEALPQNLKGIIEDWKDLKEDKIHQYGSYWVAYENIPNTPWRLTYFVNVWEIYLTTLSDIGIRTFFTLFSIGLVLLVTAYYTKKRFIRPADQLIQHIQYENQGQTGVSYQSLPTIWREWFHIITQIFQKNREMIEELRRSNESLESKVQERTEEIATQNEELLQNQEEILAQRDFINKKNTELAKVNERIQANEQVLRKSLDRLKTTQKSLEHKNKVLEDQDRRINSSISAALTIQRAILPTRKELDAILKEYFVIYRPKDRVSGDFYWCQKLDGKIFIVAADCTGHGVPGAFMTLIVSTLLDKIVRSYRVLDPAQVLSQLHIEIQSILKQKENKNNNGLDAVIINIEEQHNDQYRLIVAAAKQSMYYIPAESDELHVFKGDRKAIGGVQNEEIQFKNQVIYLRKNSLLYFGSDGFPDQNNEKRKRYGDKRLKEKILEISKRKLDRQKMILEGELDHHMANTNQRDDILLFGVKLK